MGLSCCNNLYVGYTSGALLCGYSIISISSICSQLKRIAFEKGAKLKIIPQSVFANLNSLTAIEIPASIELIEDGAFADCHSLTVITFEKNSNLKAIGNSAFDSD